MNMINIICKYQEWLTDNLTIKLISNNKKEQVYSIVTPCMNMDNDFIEIYIKVLNFNRIVITDDKNSISRLTMQGLNDENKILLLKKIVNSYQMYSCFKNIEFMHIFDIKIYILIS